MITTFDVTTLVSFHLWLDNYMLQKGQAYLNVTTPFYYQPDPSLNPEYVAYAAPFRSFVWDSGVSGATIINSINAGDFYYIYNHTDTITGLDASGNPMSYNQDVYDYTNRLEKGQSGMMIDYQGGRILLPSGFGKNAVISGSYSVKELNIYKSNETQEHLVFTDKYYLNSRFGIPQTGFMGLPPPNAYVTPCIFVTKTKGKNKPFAFGGIYDPDIRISLNVLAENMNQLEGSLSLLESAVDLYFPQLDTSVWPLNEYGDWKSGYNYEIVKSQYGQPGNLYWIKDVDTSKVSDYVKIDESIFLGIVDITLSKPRTIH